MLQLYAQVMKAVSDPTRIRILKLLGAGELCVCQIVAVLAIPQSTTSQQLGILNRAGLLNSRKEGRWVFYSLARKSDNPFVSWLIGSLDDLLEDDETIASDRERMEQLSRIPFDELCARDLAQLLDRPE